MDNDGRQADRLRPKAEAGHRRDVTLKGPSDWSGGTTASVHCSVGPFKDRQTRGVLLRRFRELSAILCEPARIQIGHAEQEPLPLG